MRTSLLLITVTIAGALLFACSDADSGGGETATSTDEALSVSSVVRGEVVFTRGISDTPGNGRVCATCHVPEDNFQLTPARVEARYQALQKARAKHPNADDPLFRSIDANDGAQDFTNLRKGLVRVVLKLPTDSAGNKLMWPVDDPNATEVAVWRAVPTVVNTGFTAPYQQDGRFPTLQAQALGAFQAHSQIPTVSTKVLDDVSDFQKVIYSSPKVALLSLALATNHTPPATDPPLNALETQGKAVFDHFCASCHGGPTQTVAVPDLAVPGLANNVFVSKPVGCRSSPAA